MGDIDKLNALLEETRAAKKAINQIEKQLKAMLSRSEGETYTEYEDSETGTRDVDALAKWLAEGTEARQREHIKTVLGIIRELEKEEGAASVDKVVELAADVGIKQADVNKELALLVRTSAIYESADKPGNYRLAK